MEVTFIEEENGDPQANVAPAELPALKVSLYELLIRQLQDDGFAGEAHSLSQQLHIQPNNRVEKDALLEAYGRSLRCASSDEQGHSQWAPVECTPVPPISAEEHVLDFDHIARSAVAVGGGDGDVEMNGNATKESAAPAPRKPAEVKLLYMAQNRLACQAVTYSNDGRFCAIGSGDGSCKVLDCQKMRLTATASEGQLGKMRVTEEDLLRPIERTFQDHAAAITCLAFHPLKPLLFSGSQDKAVKIFDLTKPSGHRKAAQVMQDVHPVRCLCMHPCGDFLMVGTKHNVIRLHDLQTQQCFTAFHQEHHHSNDVNDLRCTSDGRVFASASADGSIKLWDGVSFRVVNSLPQAHGAAAVTSIRWSRNLNYLLSAGNDGRTRIWDMRRGGEVLCMGCGPRSCEFATSVFAGGERYVVSANSNSSHSDISIYDASTGSAVCIKLGQHQQPVRALDASPSERTFMTGCDDDKARYFVIET
mmetsp:Transcript_50356/g.93120  ORF Transcript_50356/g.93120 Transcript_50356/m.93120 type:complete len:475 (+) Transcript_50356:59-1483(+)